MRDTASEIEMNSEVTYYCGLLHMDEQKQDVQLRPTYIGSVPMQDVALKTYWKRWTIERSGGRGLGRYVLMAPHNDDDEVTSQEERKHWNCNSFFST